MKPDDFNPKNPVRTRDGKAVRILCTDKKDPHFPIVALITQDYSTEYLYGYTAQGRYLLEEEEEHSNDLVNISSKRKWLNIK